MRPVRKFARVLRAPRRAAHTVFAMAFLALGCGAQAEPPKAADAQAGGDLDCPAPIGRVRKENCGEIADDFGAMTVAGSLKIVGTSKDSEQRVAAIRSAGGLAN